VLHPLLSRRRLLVGAIVALGVAVLAGRNLVDAGTPKATRSVERVHAIRTAETAKFVVHVVGAVRRPGLYRLAEGSRVADAVRRAGGATRRADLTLINLAAPAADGVQVVVPRRALPSAEATPAGDAAPAGPAGPLRLSTATLDQLDALPGVGPVTAQRILDYREEHGGFASVDDLDAVPGIGPARLEQLRELVTP
jgi:competence protein ComEA